MAISDEINRVKFIAEDFATYRSEADEFFSANYPSTYNNIIATDLGNALMDQLAFAMQSLSFMVNRRSSELFLSTARLNKSVTKLARMLGYPIQSASPASTDLAITLSEGPYSFPITINSGFKFQGPGDVFYEYRGAVPITIITGQTVVTVPIKEGQTKRVTFVSTGETNQQFSLMGIEDGQFLYDEDFIVTVDGVEWTRQDLIKYENTPVYEVLFTDDPPKLRFGDGIAGAIPAANAEIVVSFVYGKGASGAIGLNQISNPVEEMVVNGIAIPMTLTNAVSNVGENPEDIRHVRSYASSFFRTQNAAVVKSDYDTIAALEASVALSDAQIMRGITNDITIQSSLSGIDNGIALMNNAVSGIETAYVSGLDGLGVGGSELLNVSGIGYLGCVSGTVTGIEYLGISGIPLLYVSGVSGVDISDIGAITADAVSGTTLIENSVTTLTDYLSQVLSDTSASNNVQVIVLSVDANNKYISPSSTTLINVQAKLQSLTDAVVTVFAVDGSPRLVSADIVVTIGISQTAVKDDVEATSLEALIGTTEPFGLLVKRSASTSLYVSDIENAIRSANNAGDIRFINVKITGPAGLLDVDGNLIISKQQVIQNGTVSVMVTKRILANGEISNA